MMKVILDTNVLVSAIGIHSPNRIIFDEIKSGELLLAVSNDIINEYREIISHKMTSSIADNLTQYFILSPNVLKTNIYYNWSFMNNDESDNKYVDCYIASNSDFIVTNDKHFEILKSYDFPKVNIINSNDFIDLLNKK
ncbi:MAG: putative toxin-antitoxin system toxin component, PIN family [bacterium]